MSEWTPKPGDRVMVGEHGPYKSCGTASANGRYVVLDDGSAYLFTVPTSWVSPAPGPEPEEPTAFGAIVRDVRGRLWVCDPNDDGPQWMANKGWNRDWPDIPRPVTVVLADPAEVEQLRAERDAYRKAKQENDERFQVEAARQRERADELRRRIDDAYRRLSEGPAVRTYEDEVRWREFVAASLSRRGES